MQEIATCSEGIQQEERSGSRQKKLLRFPERVMSSESWEKLENGLNPKKSKGVMCESQAQPQAQEVESELRASAILSRQQWVRRGDIWGCSLQRGTGKFAAGRRAAAVWAVQSMGGAQPGAAHQGELQTQGWGQSSGFSCLCCALIRRAGIKSSSRRNLCCFGPTTIIRLLCKQRKEHSCVLLLDPCSALDLLVLVWSWFTLWLSRIWHGGCSVGAAASGDAPGAAPQQWAGAAWPWHLHRGAWGWIGVQELLCPSFRKEWNRGGCFGKIKVWSWAWWALAALCSLCPWKCSKRE